MAFKSEIHVAELAAIDTGHTEGDIYYILDNGMLTDIPCKPGDFVEWHNLKWRKLVGEHYALNSDLQNAIEVIGKPLVWIGAASVSTLNGTIEGLDSGWTYTLTDAGTLTAGSVKVEAGDEVAWSATEEEWVKIGGDSSPVLVLNTTYQARPDYNAIVAAVAAGKAVAIQNTQMDGSINVLTLVHVEEDSGYTEYWFSSYKHSGQYDILVTGANDYHDWISRYDGSEYFLPPAVIAPNYVPGGHYLPGAAVMHLGHRYLCIADTSSDDSFVAAHWAEELIDSNLAKVTTDGVFLAERKIHPGTKLLVEGLPVDGLDYELIRPFNAMIYNRVTALAASGTVTLGLWNYDTKAYVSETVLSTNSASPTVINISAANASDTMEIHLKGTGTVDSITGSIIV